MFSDVNIHIIYFKDKYDIYINQWTGIRYKNINFHVYKTGGKYKVHKKYEELFNKYNIKKLLDENKSSWTAKDEMEGIESNKKQRNIHKCQSTFKTLISKP